MRRALYNHSLEHGHCSGTPKGSGTSHSGCNAVATSDCHSDSSNSDSRSSDLERRGYRESSPARPRTQGGAEGPAPRRHTCVVQSVATQSRQTRWPRWRRARTFPPEGGKGARSCSRIRCVSLRIVNSCRADWQQEVTAPGLLRNLFFDALGVDAGEAARALRRGRARDGFRPCRQVIRLVRLLKRQPEG